jgi:hypothetical protein
MLFGPNCRTAENLPKIFGFVHVFRETRLKKHDAYLFSKKNNNRFRIHPVKSAAIKMVKRRRTCKSSMNNLI